VLQRLPIRDRGVAKAYLALAYMGAGNESEAMNLLRRGGRPEAEVLADIESLRERARQGPRR
jgi:hypothetical protein